MSFHQNTPAAWLAQGFYHARSDDGSALRANVLDAAVLGGLPPALDAVLRDYCPGVNVFIHAPLTQRIARVKEYDRCTDEEARQQIFESDVARARHHEPYVHTVWGMANEHDLTLSSTIGYDETAAMTVQVYGRTDETVT